MMPHLHRRGTGSGTPVLLLHCLGVDHRLWDLAAAGLEHDFALISYDFPGHGDSPAAERPYGIAELSAAAAAMMEREGIAHAHVGGISLGGLVAQHLAATRPELVDHLVLIDTTPRYTDAMRENWRVRAATARTKGVAVMTEALLPVWFTDAAITADGPAVRYVRDCFARCSGEGYARACEALGSADLRGLAAKITVPTLVLCGDDDIASFKEAASWMAQAIATARLHWIPQARHASVLEQPAEFAAAMQGFLPRN